MHKNEREKSLDSSTEEIIDPPSSSGLYFTLDDDTVVVENKPTRSKSIGGGKENKCSFSRPNSGVTKCDKLFQSIHHGFLTKQGGNIKNWKKRFFTLRTNKVLYYYRDINKDPQGEIDLNEPSFEIREGTCEDGCWSKIPLERTMVLVTRVRRYYLYSETVHEADKWIETIREVTRKPTIWETKAKKSYTLPAQGRSASYGPAITEPYRHKKQLPDLPLSPVEDTKPRAQTLSAKFQALPALPLKHKLSDDVTQYYGELPVHREILAAMRAEVGEITTSHYADLTDVLDESIPGETQVIKRRSALYKCRSVEDFSTSSSYEISGLEVRGVTTHLSAEHTLYDTPDGAAAKDELYGQIINGNDSIEKPTNSSRPKMQLPEITDYCTTVQPIPNSMRRALLLQDPDKAHKARKTSSISLGVGLYSTLQPDEENGIPAPIPKPRNVVANLQEELYDEVPVEEFYDEINVETRADLMDIHHNSIEIKPNKQPTNDYETLNSDAASSFTYDLLTSDTTYDEVLTGDKDKDNKNKNNEIMTSSLTDSPVLSLSRRCTTEVPNSPHSTRRKQDPLPPVPIPPAMPLTPKPTLHPSTPKSPGLHPVFVIEDTGMDDYMTAKPKKMSAIPYLGPDPLIDYTDIPEPIYPIDPIEIEDINHYERQDMPPYSKVQRANTVSVVKSVGGILFQHKKTETENNSTQDSTSSSSSEVDLTEEEKKLEKLKREFNREEKKNERIEGELKMKRKYNEIRKDQELIQQRLEGIRAKNINMMVEVGKTEVTVTKSVKPLPSENENEILRIQIEREKLEIEKERQKLDREKLEMDRERADMERMRLEHQKLLLEKEKLLFEKEKIELARAKLSSSSTGPISSDSPTPDI